MSSAVAVWQNAIKTIKPTKSLTPPLVEQATRGYGHSEYKSINPFRPYDYRNPESGREIFDKYGRISKNPLVKSALESIVSATFWSDWVIISQSDEKNSTFQRIDEIILELLNDNLKNLRYDSLRNVLESLLESGMIYGYGIAERDWQWDGRYYILDSIKHKPSYNFDFYTDSRDEIQELQWYETGKKLDPEKFIIAPYPKMYEGNWYGVSELQSIRHDIELLERLEKQRAEGMTNLLVRPLIHRYNELGRSESEVNGTKSNIQKLYESQEPVVLHLPSAMDADGKAIIQDDVLEILPERASSEAILEISKIIDQLEKRITRTLGLPDDLGKTSVSVGSQAKAREEFDLLMAKINKTQIWVENLVNRQIVAPIVNQNFRNLPQGYKIPRWKFEDVEEDSAQNRMDFFVSGIQAGIINPRELFIRDRLGLPAAQEEEVTENG